MKFRQALKSVIFIGIFLLILMSVTYIIRTNGDVKDRFTGFYAEPDNSIDVILIGSSPVYPYYAPPKLWGEYGFTSYPLSSNLQRPVAASYMVREALKTQTPSLFIFEMRMFTARESDLTNNMAYTRGVTDNMKYSLNRIKTINAMVDDKEERYTYYFDIFKYHSNWKTMVLPEQLACFRYEKPDDQKGYVMTDEVGPAQAADITGITGRQPLPAEQERALYALLDCLQENKLQALFIVSPMVMEEKDQKMYNEIKAIVEGQGYRFLNLNEHYREIGLDFASDFSDYGRHTNALGAEKCTRFLGDYVKKHYDLPDRRGDRRFSSWDASYEQYAEELEKAGQVIADRIARKDFAEPAAEE